MAYGERFEAALQLAARLHRDQVRKAGGVPYITHLLAVAALVGENGGSEDAVIAALLHDAVEDQGGAATRALIRERFGESVAGLVDAVTDTDQTPKPPWRARKEMYLKHLADAPAEARLICLADKLHNARSIVELLRREGDATWNRFRGGRDGSLWYYRSVAEALAGTGPLADELARLVDEMTRLA